MDNDVDLEVARFAEQHHGIFAFHHLEELHVTRGTRESTARLGRWVVDRTTCVYRIGGSAAIMEGRSARGVLGGRHPCCRVASFGGRAVGHTGQAS